MKSIAFLTHSIYTPNTRKIYFYFVAASIHWNSLFFAHENLLFMAMDLNFLNYQRKMLSTKTGWKKSKLYLHYYGWTRLSDGSIQIPRAKLKLDWWCEKERNKLFCWIMPQLFSVRFPRTFVLNEVMREFQTIPSMCHHTHSHQYTRPFDVNVCAHTNMACIKKIIHTDIDTFIRRIHTDAKRGKEAQMPNTRARCVLLGTR